MAKREMYILFSDSRRTSWHLTGRGSLTGTEVFQRLMTRRENRRVSSCHSRNDLQAKIRNHNFQVATFENMLNRDTRHRHGRRSEILINYPLEIVLFSFQRDKMTEIINCIRINIRDISRPIPYVQDKLRILY